MFEQDYIMRIIHEISRVLAKVLFNADSKTVEDLGQDDKVSGQAPNDLFQLVDQGRINEAENKIYELADSGDPSTMRTVLQFYEYLNDKPDSFLEAHDFSREEILSGLKDNTARYGISGLLDAF